MGTDARGVTQVARGVPLFGVWSLQTPQLRVRGARDRRRAAQRLREVTARAKWESGRARGGGRGAVGVT